MNRLIARKLWISDIFSNPYIENSGEYESNYISFNNQNITRVNLIATIIGKSESQDKNYASLTLDDGTEQIRIKAWKEDTKLLSKFSIGEIVLIIGKIRKYNEEIYLLAEIIKSLNPNWELLRKLELIKLYGKPKNLKSEELIDSGNVLIEEVNLTSNNLGNDILNLIEKYEEKEGISLEELKTELGKGVIEINNVLESLVKEGQVYSVGHKFRLLI